MAMQRSQAGGAGVFHWAERLEEKSSLEMGEAGEEAPVSGDGGPVAQPFG